MPIWVADCSRCALPAPVPGSAAGTACLWRPIGRVVEQALATGILLEIEGGEAETA